MNEIKIKRGDTAIRIQDTLLIDGDPADLAGATVILVIRPADGGAILRRTASVLEQTEDTDPNVEYLPITADTAAAGTYLLEWEVTFSGGKILSFPAEGFDKMTIGSDNG